METIIYNQKGKESGTIKLPDTVFGLPWNADLVHQVAVSMQANLRTPVAHTKDRGEVRGGGKKPWRQKGTGRARHGSIRSPLWSGGGVTHGPTNEKVFARKINRNMKTKALFTVLSKKFKDGELLFLDSVSLPEAKTKEAKKVLEALSGVKGFEKMLSKKQNALHLAFPKKDAAIERCFQNFGSLSQGELRNLNVLDLLNTKYVVLLDPKEAVKMLETKIA